MSHAVNQALSLIPGVEFDFGAGRIYVVPPLSFGALEQVQSRLDGLLELQATDPVAVRTIIDVTHLALMRNYPAMTRAEVGELVDPANFGDVYGCLMDIGGLRRQQQQEQRATLGNAAAKGPTTGAGSSPE